MTYQQRGHRAGQKYSAWAQVDISKINSPTIQSQEVSEKGVPRSGPQIEKF